MRGVASHQSSSSIYYAENEQPRDDGASLKSEQLGKMNKANPFLLPAFFLECAILACLAVFAYYFRFNSPFKGHHRLIPCFDQSLMYPYQPDGAVANSSVLVYVDDNTLYSVSFLLPVGLIIFIEVVFGLFSPGDRKVVTTLSQSLKIPLVVRRILRFVGTFWMGALINSIVTDSVKLLSGRPRPYFLTTCNSTCPLQQIFITANDCQKPDDQREAQLSFPSYYASISSYAAVFAICYLQTMAKVHGNYFLRPVLLASLAGMSLLAGFSKWTLYANHWEDLLVGYVMGAAFALYISFPILNGFRENKPRKLNENIREARPGFFSWFALPRIPVRTKSRGPFPPTVYVNGNTESNTPSSVHGPNPAFQQDLHRRVEDFGRKNMNPSSPSRTNY